MRSAGLITILVLLLTSLLPGCTEETKVDVASRLHPDSMATMTTRNISTLISDSGVIQYKIVAPIWKVYDKVDDPYWIFPEGLYLQKYDPYFHVVATVAADSARYYKNKKLWRLEGNVEMTKVPKDLFLSQRLYWNQKQGEIYSDTFIHIETETHVLEGIGFRSNETLTSYRILQPQGIFPVENPSGNAGASPETASKTASEIQVRNDSTVNQ